MKAHLIIFKLGLMVLIVSLLSCSNAQPEMSRLGSDSVETGEKEIRHEEDSLERLSANYDIDSFEIFKGHGFSIEKHLSNLNSNPELAALFGTSGFHINRLKFHDQFISIEVDYRVYAIKQENGLYVEDVDAHSFCQFEKILSESAQEELQALADDLAICQKEKIEGSGGGIDLDSSEDGIYLRASAGLHSLIIDDKNSGESQLISFIDASFARSPQPYICGSRDKFTEKVTEILDGELVNNGCLIPAPTLDPLHNNYEN